MVVAKEGGDYYPGDLVTAERLFGPLIEESGASGILALRNDSSDVLPVGLEELAAERGLSAECVQIDRLDPSSWTGNVVQNEIWSDLLETVVCNSQLSSQNSECIFLMNTGSNLNAALLHALHVILGGSLWVTEGDRSSPKKMDGEIPDEGSGGEAVLASLAAFGIGNPGSMANTTGLQGLVEGFPTGRGVENSLRGFKQYLTTDVRPDGNQYGLTAQGRYNALLSLARRWEPLSVQGGPRGLVIFVRSVQESESIVRYLREHPTVFDKFAFVVGGIDVKNEKEVSIRVHGKAAGHLGADKVASTPEEVCFSIPADRGVRESSADVMEILQRVRQDNSGIEWSIDVTGVLGLLRAAVLQFAHFARINCCYMARHHPVGSGVYKSGLGGYKHLLALPDISQLGSISGLVTDSNVEYRRFIATVYRFHKEKSGSEMGIEKKFEDCRPYDFNMLEFSTGHPLRMNEIAKGNRGRFNAMKRHLEKAEKGRLLYRDGKAIHLTPEGVVAGALIKG